MPETRKRATRREHADFGVSKGTHKATVLTLLARDSSIGYKPKEILKRTDVPQGSLGKVLQRLRDHDLVVKEDGHYFVATGKMDEIRTFLFDESQLAAASEISDDNTAPDSDDFEFTPTDELLPDHLSDEDDPNE